MLEMRREYRGDYYQCDICTECIHAECVTLSASEQRCMPLNKRTLIFACDGCKVVVKKIPSIISLIEELKQQIENMNVKETSTHVKTFSEVVKKTREEVIVIKPKNREQGSSATRKAIEKQVNPGTIGAEVSRVRFVRDGGVAISCKKREDIKNISEKIKKHMSDDYEINVPEKKNPRVKITNIEKKLTEDEDTLIETIVLQNNITTDKNRIMKVIATYEDKQRKSETVIMEVDHETYGQITKKDVLHIGWRKCRYFDHVNVVQCYKCWKFGHMSNQCRGSNVVCPRCSEHHKQQDCKSEVEVCTNCKHAKEVLKITGIDIQHSAFNRKCEAYKRIFEQLQMRVNYPNEFNRARK